jgi:hypothetical protein
MPLTQFGQRLNTVDPNRLTVTPVTPALYENAGNGESKVEVAKVKRLDSFPYQIGGKKYPL